jgi:hypothetical protein
MRSQNNHSFIAFMLDHLTHSHLLSCQVTFPSTRDTDFFNEMTAYFSENSKSKCPIDNLELSSPLLNDELIYHKGNAKLVRVVISDSSPSSESKYSTEMPTPINDWDFDTDKDMLHPQSDYASSEYEVEEIIDKCIIEVQRPTI